MKWAFLSPLEFYTRGLLGMWSWYRKRYWRRYWRDTEGQAANRVLGPAPLRDYPSSLLSCLSIDLNRPRNFAKLTYLPLPLPISIELRPFVDFPSTHLNPLRSKDDFLAQPLGFGLHLEIFSVKSVVLCREYLSLWMRIGRLSNLESGGEIQSTLKVVRIQAYIQERLIAFVRELVETIDICSSYLGEWRNKCARFLLTFLEHFSAISSGTHQKP